MDVFEVLAAPGRRRILHALQRAPRSVNELAESLDENQPTVSKHLKVLHTAGFVACRSEGPQRIYSLEPAPFRELEAWLEPYRQLWMRHLDKLEQFLDSKEKSDEAKRVSARQPARRQHAAGRRRARHARPRS